jgi:hypothetical protein
MTSTVDLDKYWTPIYNAFNPYEPLLPHQLDEWFVERPDSPLPVLFRHLNPARALQRLIFGGHPASGKSSELAKLAVELERNYGYFVTQINLEYNLRKLRETNQIEVLFLMGAALFKVAKAAQLNPDQKRFDNLVNALETLVQTHTENRGFKVNISSLLNGLVCFGTFIAGPAGAAAALVATDLLRPFDFVSGTDIATVRKLEVEPRIAEVVQQLNSIIDDVAAKAKRPLVLIVDGTDKVNMNVAELLFAQPRFLADPACRVIYTAPMEVFYRPQFAVTRGTFRVLPFPNIRLRRREDPSSSDETGYETMREVLRRRLISLRYDPETVIDKEAMDLLIQNSGGLMRDLVQLMQDAVVGAEIARTTTIDREVAMRTVSAWRRQFQAQLTPKCEEVLRSVRQNHLRTDDEECDTLLEGNFILSYINNDVWFDVHSILS